MLDLTKPIQTRSGRPARLIAANVTAPIPGVSAHRSEGQPILAEVTHTDGSRLHYFSPDGRFMGYPTCTDLVNVPQPVIEIVHRAIRPNPQAPMNNVLGCATAPGCAARGDTWADKVLAITYHDGQPVSAELV